MTSEDRDFSTVDQTPEGSRSAAFPAAAPGRRTGRAARRAARKERGSSRKSLPVWQETLLLLVAAVGLAVLVKALFLQAFYIPSESMEPGLEIDDRILVEKPSYWFGGEPQRGDVVVFADPGGWLGPEEAGEPTNPVTAMLARIGLYPTGGHLVKRVIGVEGDVVECCDEQGRILVNGTPLEERDFARPNGHGCADGAQGACFGPMPGTGSWTAGPVPAGKLFVMGDNRAHSADSSFHLCSEAETECTSDPYVDVDSVVGKVMAVVWPAGKAGFEDRPDTFDDVARPRGGAGQ